ncbi:type I toxin-antitoxin system Fst family toxin [Listeria kieliensis]|nr:type I toxin-antitoxin system Fst family toxin [Listeria kieliensis]
MSTFFSEFIAPLLVGCGIAWFKYMLDKQNNK